MQARSRQVQKLMQNLTQPQKKICGVLLAILALLALLRVTNPAGLGAMRTAAMANGGGRFAKPMKYNWQSFEVKDKSPLRVTNPDVLTCKPKSPEETKKLAEEIRNYEKSSKFQNKIKEAQGLKEPGLQHFGIMKFLKRVVLDPGMSVLELGCAAGGILRLTRDVYVENNWERGTFVGVELVTGWVKWAQSFYTDLHIFEGDITEFTLPPGVPEKFDLVMLNDVMEHIQPHRYECFFKQLDKVTHPGSVVYMHTPAPETQLIDTDQTYENVLPHHLVVMGMASAGFELAKFEHDFDTATGPGCGGAKKKELQANGLDDEGQARIPRIVRGAGCHFFGWPKYTHSVYQKAHDKRIFTLTGF